MFANPARRMLSSGVFNLRLNKRRAALPVQTSPFGRAPAFTKATLLYSLLFNRRLNTPKGDVRFANKPTAPTVCKRRTEGQQFAVGDPRLRSCTDRPVQTKRGACSATGAARRAFGVFAGLWLAQRSWAALNGAAREPINGACSALLSKRRAGFANN